MRTRILIICLMVLPLLVLTSNLQAQSDTTSTCGPMIQSAFSTLDEACSGAGANSACFGSSANATLNGGNSATFSKSGDVVDLSQLESVHTLPLDTQTNQWGLASMNVHANVPLALSDKGLKYILVGDVEVENAVTPEDAFTPAPAVTVTPLVAANLRTGPSTDAQVIVSAKAGTELSADALSQDGGWVRVLNDNETAWISRQVVAAKDGKIDDLPKIGSNTRTFMQSFYLKTGQDLPDCSDAPPSMLVIQSPNGLNANITANGANIRFTSSIAMFVSADNNLHIIVLDGGANMGGISIPAGFTLSVPLAPDGHGVASPPTGLRPITDGERGLLTLAAGDISKNLLYTPLTVPTAEEVSATLVQINSAAAGAGQTTTGPASGKADCSRFKPTSPLGSLVNGSTPFYWDGAPGATTYRINVYSADGSLRSSNEINSNTTTLTVDTAGGIGDGTNFAWNVEALVDGQVACTTARVSLPRDAFPQFAGNTNSGGAKPTACPWSSC